MALCLPSGRESNLQPRRSAASRRMLAMPQAGPRARTGKAQRQPIWLARGGISWIETVVRRKPRAVWTVRAVPTACGGTDSVTKALNWALSAITKKPQAQASRVTRGRLAPKRKPMVRAQVPLGTAEPSRDLAPLVQRLAATHDESDQDDLIRAIDSLGRHDGHSSAAVKAYLREAAPPVLLAIARGKAPSGVRGSALMALRSLNVDDTVLDEAIAIANGDTGP